MEIVMATKFSPKEENTLYQLISNLMQYISGEKRDDWYFDVPTDNGDLPSIFVPFRYDNNPDNRGKVWEIRFSWSGDWEMDGEYDCGSEWFLTVENSLDRIHNLIKENYMWINNFSNEVLPTKRSIVNARERAAKLKALYLHEHPQYKSFCKDWYMG